MIKSLIRKVALSAGYNLVRRAPVNPESHSQAAGEPTPPELSTYDLETAKLARAHSMTSPARLHGLIKAVHYLSQSKIEGAMVECGVWKGGSMLAVARTLVDEKDTARELYLYDTFDGMPPPTAVDVDFAGVDAQQQLDTTSKDGVIWAMAQLDVVKQTMALSAYNDSRIHYIKGKVEDTIPASIPGQIALLRLDTDWYESTRHEMEHLFPRLARGGVLIIDDYGHWQGARRAVDEYVAAHGQQILLNIIDYTGRIGVKVF